MYILFFNNCHFEVIFEFKLIYTSNFYFCIISDEKTQSKSYKTAYECIYGVVPIGTSKNY